MDLLASIVTVAPSLAFALSGTSAFPGVLALSGTEPVLRFVDIAVNHKLSGLFVSSPVASVEGLFVWEHFVKVFWVSISSLDGRSGGNKCNDSKFHD